MGAGNRVLPGEGKREPPALPTHALPLPLAARDGAPCVFSGMVYRSGESFQSSCKYQCTCLDGAVGCVPLCSMDVRLPSPDCPYPRRVKLPGKCCEEWVCEEAKEQTAVGPALAGEWGALCGWQPGEGGVLHGGEGSGHGAEAGGLQLVESSLSVAACIS